MAHSGFQFDEKEQTQERVLLVSADFPSQNRGGDDFKRYVEECRGLIEAAGGKITGSMECKRAKPDPAFFVGSGKAEEIKAKCQELGVDLIVVNHELSPSQQRNIEKLCDTRAIDRVGLILAIFASRARTQEGKIQVELAQLQYLQTRLVRAWSHLQSQTGGIGLKGPGETQLETDRRIISKKIDFLKGKLKEIKKRRKTQRKSRLQGGDPIVALVGYTNAGKSTLFNRLTKSKVFVKDQVFATLDTTARKLWLGPGRSIALTDTVGFIRNLPTALVAAFSATLEESRYADLLLHVVDSSHPAYEGQMEDVEATLREIKADDIPSLTVYNKIDLSDDPEPAALRDPDGAIRAVRCSAATGAGLDLLRGAICEALDRWPAKPRCDEKGEPSPWEPLEPEGGEGGADADGLGERRGFEGRSGRGPGFEADDPRAQAELAGDEGGREDSVGEASDGGDGSGDPARRE